MFSREKGNRGTTQTCGQRHERSEKKHHAGKGAGVRYPQNHSPGTGEPQITHHGEEIRAFPKVVVSEQKDSIPTIRLFSK